MVPFMPFIMIVGGVTLMMPYSDAENSQHPPLQSVPYVDISRYVGIWYEIAKIPNSFQRQCVGSTTAEYRLLPDGNIAVINSCRKKDGRLSRVEGIAKEVDEKTNAKLKVSFVSLFGLHLFWGDYWIIALDEAYQWAIVGTPSRKYGWILSRSPRMDAEQMAKMNQLLLNNGYNPAAFTKSDQ